MGRILSALGNLDWGMVCAFLVLCATTVIAASAQALTTMYSFNGTDGALPFALVQANDGNFYGTTSNGGKTSSPCNTTSGCGTVFKITPSGALTTLYRFCAQSACSDGYSPSGLAQSASGDFYGTASAGGNTNCQSGCGTVFKITPGGKLTTLYSFCSQNGCTDGYLPTGLVRAPSGDFYGTTYHGGAHGEGTVFKVTPAGTLTTLYSFCAQNRCTDGAYPYAGFVQGANGDLYGTTIYGGARQHAGAVNGAGTVFEITPSGTLTTLHRFCSQSGANCADGQNPNALIQATNGSLYGTTVKGGINGRGTIFEIASGGALTTLYNFCSQSACADGANPLALVQATDGNFYGTTTWAGASGDGTIFEITQGGTLTTLYSFCSLDYPCTDQAYSLALVQGTDGNFYGTTAQGGTNNDGTVFSLSVGLGPFVKSLPAYGQAGAAVQILGNNLTGTTSVSFNGTAATFTVVSQSLITTTVPAGATTGTVQVVTPSVTLSSNAPFQVLP